MDEPMWIYNPGILFKNSNLIPTTSMEEVERLNTLTRLVVVIAVLLFFLSSSNTSWWLFLGLGIILILLLYYVELTNKSKEGNIENYRCIRQTLVPSINVQPSQRPRPPFRLRAKNL